LIDRNFEICNSNNQKAYRFGNEKGAPISYPTDEAGYGESQFDFFG